MSPLVLSKAIVCLVVIYWSPWISLAELSHSSFALVVSYVLPLTSDADEGY
jgi:hypothetical protein